MVCASIGEPSAVLIRGVEGLDGPGKLTQKLKIDKSFSGKVAKVETGLWFEDQAVKVGDFQVEVTKRIGVDYAKRWAEKPWRFKLLTNANGLH